MHPARPVSSSTAPRDGTAAGPVRNENRSGSLLRAVAASLLVAGLAGCRPPAVEPHSRATHPAPTVRVARTVWLMGAPLRIQVDAAERAAAIAAAEAALRAVARVESVLSSWDPDAELARLNRAPPGRPAAVSPELAEYLARAEAWADATGRAFDPAVGPHLDALARYGAAAAGPAGGGPAVRGAPVPAPPLDALRRARAAAQAGVALDPGGRTATRRHPDARLDAGAFGKGAGLEAAARALSAEGVAGAVLDFGGQVSVVGGDAAFRAVVGVAHPSRRGETALTLRLGPGLSAATSGDGERPGHLVDPRTGRPVRGRWSATVVSTDALAADALATALYVMGPDAGLAWARGRPLLAILYLEETGNPPGPGGLRARWTPAMEARLGDVPAGLRQSGGSDPGAPGTLHRRTGHAPR